MSEVSAIRGLCAKADVGIDGGRSWDIRVRDQRFYDCVIADGSLGLGEAYMRGYWEANDLFGCISHILSCDQLCAHKNYGWRTSLAFLKARLLNVQSISQTRSLADVHYNLNTELFEHMLGPSMAYSCAYWLNAATLDDAQIAKFDLICRKLHLKEGERLLDIGCGWGGFAHYAAENYGVEVVGITVADEQAAYARELCTGLPVEIFCGDYREFPTAEICFDKAASIGMIEHVGTRNYRTLFSTVESALRPRGLFLLHSITSPVSSEVGEPWLTTYIFPGGVLPSMRQLSESAERLFVLQDMQNIGPHYTPTLRAWLDNFEAWWETASPYAKPSIWNSQEAFYRMWRYYLSSCAAEFHVGGSQVAQLVYSKGHLPGCYTAAR
ncbi:MAG: hypothetical protein APF80_13630 [Alphaproteobacteria bacterium BRH_c36]|nr:MAG: hypothetical protein APF80_13630 [Alphaproteobacteria bacterium BRH_c36]